MKPIKYRAWHESLKKMVEVYEIIFSTATNRSRKWEKQPRVITSVGLLTHSPIMLYIGLKDKSGIEIYEEDIVKLVNKSEQEDKGAEHMQGIGIVGFDLKDLGFGWSRKLEGRPFSPLTWGGTKSVEIIGNIYQNKDLLK